MLIAPEFIKSLPQVQEQGIIIIFIIYPLSAGGEGKVQSVKIA